MSKLKDSKFRVGMSMMVYIQINTYKLIPIFFFFLKNETGSYTIGKCGGKIVI